MLSLSDATYSSSSIAAVGVAAHETGHAIQHNTGYFPLSFRRSLVPVANLGSRLGPLMAVAMTYVASALSAVGSFLRLLLITNSRRRRR
ncbi:zinc metallopeptidase [Treponema sp. C6A8]|uniref:zinc metallopeptidase n=1 Tax=Treponema sp. C6A8 TaxID=1410609 RepID=UPI002110A68C|nr:zinc metallopeptidase [Treponema sp. C6A8]